MAEKIRPMKGCRKDSTAGHAGKTWTCRVCKKQACGRCALHFWSGCDPHTLLGTCSRECRGHLDREYRNKIRHRILRRGR